MLTLELGKYTKITLAPGACGSGVVILRVVNANLETSMQMHTSEAIRLAQMIFDVAAAMQLSKSRFVVSEET